MQMKKLSDYSLTWKLLLVPVVATLSFAGYLVYSSLVLSDGNLLLKEIRYTDFTILETAEKILTDHERVVDALNTAAATGEVDFLDVASTKAAETLIRYETLAKLDTDDKAEVEKLKSEFSTYFALAIDVAQRMATKKNMPSAQQISKMRAARDAYLSEALAYRDVAEREFQETVSKAMERSERARAWGAGIGTFMLLVIAALTLLVTRGILSLEKGVAERNKKLAEVNSELEYEIQKLKEAEEARSHAEAASQIKDEFLANVSHELRTPMNAIIGLSHLCLQTDMSGKQHDYLQKIYGSAKSLLGILNDILDVSKIEAGKMEMDNTPFDLEEVMGNLATMVGNKSQEKNLEFLLETAPDVPSLLIGDPLRLSQVLINLTSNAVKFTEKGEVVVRVELEKKAGNQVTLRFTVKDTGIGMSQQEIGKLFRPFTQADTSITRKFGGTGLGLTISKRLIEMMGGRVWVESASGAGSRFIFTARFQAAEKQANYHQPVLNDLRSLRVIAVDDNESSLQILKSYLESFTFDVTVASNGRDALDMVRRADEEGRPFGLAILDWKMPQMDGMELARKLRDMADLRVRPKVLLISAYGQNEMLLHMDEHVVDGILAKPFQQSRLFDAVARISGRDMSATGKFRIGAQFNPELVSQIRGARLLLVEDNEINQQVARELLESFGIKVAVAENGEEAIALLMNEPFDGVLMDMQMPVMDGISATREIRKNPRFSKLPIIALTANVMVSEQNEFLGAGMNDHIGKPIDPDQLVVKLAKWVHPTRTMESPPAPRTVSISATESFTDLTREKIETSLASIAGARVLLVEDNEFHQHVASELLSYAGAIVEIAENGQEAVNKVQSRTQSYDIVLMDMQMPVMDGMSATRILRSQPQYADLPILALTANARQTDHEACLTAGMNGHLSKPIEADALWRALLQWVRPRAGLGTLPAARTVPDTAQATQPLTDTLPQDIAGLDTESGLHRVLGNKASYVSILRKFMVGQRDFAARFEQAVVGGDAETAERLAHTLNGVSGNIGARDLSAVSKALEAAVRKVRETNHALTPAEVVVPLAALLPVLTELLAALERHFSTNTLPAQSPQAIDTARLKDVCRHLHTLLAGDYPEAEKVYAEHAELLNAAFADRAKKIESSITRFDFESALDLLQQAMKQAGLDAKDDDE